MRLGSIVNYMKSMGCRFTYHEEDDCGSIEFEHRGLHYHIWEFPAPERGCEANLRSAGRSEEYEGDYEAQLLAILRSWEGTW